MTLRRSRPPLLAHAETLPAGELAVLDLYAPHREHALDPRGARGSLARRACGGPDTAGASPDRGRGRGAAPGPGDVGDRPVHVPARTERAGRGRGAARPAPDDGRSPAAVAPARVRPRAARLARGHLHVPRRRARQREGRAVVRAGRGPRPHRRPRRRGRAVVAPGARTGARVGARERSAASRLDGRCTGA